MNKKAIGKFAVVGLALIILLGFIFLVSALTYDEETSLQSELSNLTSELNNRGYGWLADYDLSYPSIGVYTENNDILITKFENINEENWYKVYLTNLQGEYDTFDLKIKTFGGSDNFIEFDYIVDPTIAFATTNITLSKGINLISFSFGQKDKNTDRNISLAQGWNLIGYSSETSLALENTKFIDSNGNEFSWKDAVSNGKLRAYLIYYDSFNETASERKNKYVATADLEMDDSYLHQNYGYWVYANEPGNLTLPNAGGSLSNQIYLWNNNLKLNNGTDEVNITDKENRWMCNSSTCSENVIYYWNPLKEREEGYDSVCGNRAYCDKTTISPYEGYAVWSNYDGITLIIGN